MENKNFNKYNLSSDILKSLELMDYKVVRKVQQEVIPRALNHEDMIVRSQTGSGKTAAFGIPICELINWEENKPQALILTPTRELAIQVGEELFNIGRFKRLKLAALYGKSPFWKQEKLLKQKTHIVSGTPGRVLDHIEKESFDISNIKYLIIDEADEMLNMGFIEQLSSIILRLPKERLTMLFSATMPADIEDLCSRYMKNPSRIEIEGDKEVERKIQESIYRVLSERKLYLLNKLCISKNPDTCMIFCNTRKAVDQVDESLFALGYRCDRIHGGMEQEDRITVMNNFREGKFRYLIATDVAARGIDIDNISLVINYDIPEDKENYVHRIGRTGRSGKHGEAISLVDDFEVKYLEEIEEYLGEKIHIRMMPSDEEITANKDAFEKKMKTSLNKEQSKSEKLGKDILKLHINAGKKTKMRPVDIVGTLCSIEGMNAQDIGIINIMDISTFVEILNNKGEMVYKVLQNKKIKGRVRKVSKADN